MLIERRQRLRRTDDLFNASPQHFRIVVGTRRRPDRARLLRSSAHALFEKADRDIKEDDVVERGAQIPEKSYQSVRLGDCLGKAVKDELLVGCPGGEPPLHESDHDLIWHQPPASTAALASRPRGVCALMAHRAAGRLSKYRGGHVSPRGVQPEFPSLRRTAPGGQDSASSNSHAHVFDFEVVIHAVL